MLPASSKPAVNFPDIWTVGEIKAIWGVDPRKSPLTYRFSFFDPDLSRLRSYLQKLIREGFFFDGIEPPSPAFERIYGAGCWMMTVNITGVLPSSKLKAFGKRFCEDTRSGKVWALFTTIGCRHPAQDSRPADWEKRWNKAIAKGQETVERRKIIQTRLALPHLDDALKNLKPSRGSQFTAWLAFVKMKVKGLGLVLTDMRPGPSEDELLVALPRGEYEISLRAHVRTKRIAGLRALKHAAIGSRARRLGMFATDMASLGVYDPKSMAALLRKGREAFSEWGEDARGDVHRPYDVLVHDLKAGAILPCVQTGLGDGTFPVYELAANDRRVGFEVEFINESGEVPAIKD